MGNIVCTADLFSENLAHLASAGHIVHLIERDASASLASILCDADALICLLTDRIGSDTLVQAHRLRVIATVAVGYENIDLAAASERGIVVCNTPDVLTQSTADQTFALLLAAARRIPEADCAVREGRFPRWGLQQPLTGTDVYGKTLGIVGMGRIGAAVAHRGHLGFGMPILYVSRTRKPLLEEDLGAVQVSLERLLEESDFVCIHVPLTPQTTHLIDASALARMKPSAILINASRGAVVDEAALVNALNEHAIAGVGLDVFEQEPKVHPGLLSHHEHVVLAPHLGSATGETRQAMAAIAVSNVLAVLAGKPPLTPVS